MAKTAKTPKKKPLTRKQMYPVTMRVTPLQHERLLLARDRDGLAIQEHVRRALDLYLAQIEKPGRNATTSPDQAELPVKTPANDVAPHTAAIPARSTARQSRPKIARR